jgi:hypothetical protein
MKIEPSETTETHRPRDHETTSSSVTTAKSAAAEQSGTGNTALPKRISKRGTTKVKKESETAAGGDGGEKDEELLGTAAGENIKRRRTWELWSASDKHIFFDAINEFGKDFDSIQQHFQAGFADTNPIQILTVLYLWIEIII